MDVLAYRYADGGLRSGVLVAAGLLGLTGLVWMGQGLGYIRGSFMTGQMTWFWIGLGCVVIALAVTGLASMSAARSNRVPPDG